MRHLPNLLGLIALSGLLIGCGAVAQSAESNAAPTRDVAPLAAVNTVTPVPTVAPTNTPSPTMTASPEPTQPRPTETAEPTATNEPTAAPLPTEEQPTVLPTEPTSLRLMGFDNAADTGTWYIVNDTVMGGVSTAQGYVDNSVLMFNGDLSLDNNGGFTSIRRELRTDLTDFTGIQMRVRGDGRSYYLRLSDYSDRRETSHEQLFATQAGEWTTVSIPFDQLAANFRGFAIDRPPIDPANLLTLSIMLREKDPGYFQLEIDWIQAYK